MAKITHDEARAIAHRFIDGHFRNKGEGPRVSIPARPEYDDDIRLTDYIDQQTAVDSELAELRVALAEVDMILGVVGADRDCRRMLLCAMRARTKAVEAEIAAARGAIGALWLKSGASLAEAITLKTSWLESLGEPGHAAGLLINIRKALEPALAELERTGPVEAGFVRQQVADALRLLVGGL